MNERVDLLRVQSECRPGAAHHILFHHHRTEIIRAISERDLSDLRALRHPGTLHIVDIVEENPGQCLCPQIFSYSGGVLHLQNRVLGLKRLANKCRKPAAPVLLFANASQMLDSIFDRLHMPEHHGRARFQSQLVRDLHHLQPFVAIDFQR